jgi:hypothetical protein
MTVLVLLRLLTWLFDLVFDPNYCGGAYFWNTDEPLADDTLSVMERYFTVQRRTESQITYLEMVGYEIN